MKKNQNKSQLAVPKNAQSTMKTVDSIDYSDGYDITTQTLGTWISCNWAGAMASFAGFTFLPVGNLLYIPLTLAIITGISALFIGIGSLIHTTSLTGPISVIRSLSPSTNRKQLARNFGNNSEIVISHKVRPYSFLHLFLPFRMFKKQLVSEKVTYHAVADTYTKFSTYFTFRGVIVVEEDFKGRRAIFRKALESI